jgi:ribose transport system substrate-binding protein
MRTTGQNLLFVLLIVIAALGSPPSVAAATQGRIYYLIPTLVDDFQTESQRMIEGVFSTLNYEVISVDADGDPELQIQQLSNAAADNPVAIILNAVDSLSISRALKEIKPKGIPVLVYDRMLADDDEFQFASVSDAESIGEMAGQKAIDLLSLEADNRKTILQIAGDPGDSYSLRVLRGFQTIIRYHTQVDVITIPAMAWEPLNARKIAEELQQAKRHIDLIFCHSADLANAVIPLFEADIHGGRVKVMAITGAPVGLDNLEKRLQQFEIEQPTYAQVYGLALGLRHVLARKAGKPGLQDGPCNLMGIRGRLEQNAKVLKLAGRPLELGDLRDRKKLGLWGDLARPVKSADEINSLKCDGP